MAFRLIETDADVAEGAAWLAAREPRFAQALVLTGPLPLRRKADGFAALVEAIVSQQVSTASAAAIHGRMAALALTSAESIAGAADEALRAAGLSRPKMRHLRALAGAPLDYQGLRQAEDAEVVARLVAQPGIGVWTAEVYGLISLGRADMFAPGDLALQEAARLLFGLSERPGERALRTMAEVWSPWRGVAARLLWSYYRVTKGREGMR